MAVEFEIMENIAVISEGSKGWQKELNLVKWGDGEPKFDIRQWSPDHTKMGKGITLSNEEMNSLAKIIKENF